MKPTFEEKLEVAIPLFASAILGILGAIILFCSGCSINRQTGISVVFDPKTGITTTNSLSMVTFTTGNAKTAIESQRGSVGKTISIGVKGLNEETDMATTIKAVGDAATQVFSAGAAAAAGVVAKSIAP